MDDDTLAAVGPRLRALRQERDTTLAELSEQTGISVSTMSRLESGARRPTLELLLPLARAHGVTLDELVDAPPTGDPRVHLRAVKARGMTMVPLTRRAGGIQAYKLVIPPGRRAPTPSRRPTRATSGCTSSTAGCGFGSAEHDVVLEPGEAAEFDTRVPHWFGPRRRGAGRGAQPVRQAGRASPPAGPPRAPYVVTSGLSGAL